MNPEALTELVLDLLDLRNDVDCRIEHGACSGGHLEYVRECLTLILADAQGVAPCDLDPSGRAYGF